MGMTDVAVITETHMCVCVRATNTFVNACTRMCVARTNTRTHARTHARTHTHTHTHTSNVCTLPEYSV